MYKGELWGDHDVPDPICPQYRRLSVSPTRTAMSLPFMTSIGPRSWPDISPISLFFVSAAGDGDGDGIGIPGMFSILCVGDGDAFGAGEGVGIEWLGCCACTAAAVSSNIGVSSNSLIIFP